MRGVIAVSLLLVTLAALPLQGHIAVPADFREVVADASLIVRGRVTDVRSIAVPGGGIDSVATVAIDTVLKGQASGFVYVRVPGGQIGRTRVVMIGAPTFRVGQRSVLFLRRIGTETAFRPVGLTMGVYGVQSEPATRRLVVQPPIVAGRNAAATGPIVRGDRARKAMPVAEFESLVRLVVATPPGRAVGRGGR